jgi:hypothetical protein
MFVGKAESSPSAPLGRLLAIPTNIRLGYPDSTRMKHISGAPLKGKLLAVHINIRLDWALCT